MQGGALYRLEGDATEIPFIQHGRRVLPPVNEIRGEPQPCDVGLGLQAAHELKDFLDGRADDAGVFDLDQTLSPSRLPRPLELTPYHFRPLHHRAKLANGFVDRAGLEAAIG